MSNHKTDSEKQCIRKEREEFKAKQAKVRKITAIVTVSVILILLLTVLIGIISYNIRMNGGEAADKNLGVILDADLDRMKEGDTITHFRGTHLYQVISFDKSHPDHFIGKL